MNRPFVSIIMPAYNVPKDFFIEAVQSIIGQSYTDFELIIIDDGSMYPVKSMLEGIEDRRIIVIENEKNSGLPFTLNRGIKSAKGKYIFRMDSDDYSLAQRIEKQVAFLEEHEDIDLLATFAKTFGSYEVLYKSTITNDELRAELLWKNPLIHPTVVFRASTIEKKNIQYLSNFSSEDYALWSAMAFEHNCKLAVIPEVLLKYRIHGNQVTATKKQILQESEKRILSENFKRLKISLNKDEIDLYCRFREKVKLNVNEFNMEIIILKKILNQLPEDISRYTLKRIYYKAIFQYCLYNRQFTKLTKIFLLK